MDSKQGRSVSHTGPHNGAKKSTRRTLGIHGFQKGKQENPQEPRLPSVEQGKPLGILKDSRKGARRTLGIPRDSNK